MADVPELPPGSVLIRDHGRVLTPEEVARIGAKLTELRATLPEAEVYPALRRWCDGEGL
jgi:hypothetical protein